MIKKTCSCCKETKPLEKFSSQARGKFGRKAKCKQCIRNYNKKYHRARYLEDEDYRQRRKENAKQWVDKNPSKRAAIAKRRNQKEIEKCPEKVKARALVNQKVKFGRMPKVSSLPCHNCGNQAHEYHHHRGYSWEYRYDVVALCRSCHRKADS